MRLALAPVALALFLSPALARAHCDTLDGPVVKAGEASLRTGDPSAALAWVQAKDEPEIRAALKRAVAVRKTGGEAQKLADTWFFETLVRVHRAGEGAPYTGVKPAGQDLGPAIPAADSALETGDPKPLVKFLETAAHEGLHGRYVRAVEAKKHAGESVEAGRRYVAAYVDYVHYVERVHQATEVGAHAHGTTAQAEHAH
ncbi:MAG TPA: DUF6448 family protein [Anaeromyxobacteraceae bacterium]|nr:DUF6448 family protein [Anaeromyxobacteraceae bacterium]